MEGFCIDLENFLLDMLLSCPKACKQFDDKYGKKFNVTAFIESKLQEEDKQET